MDSNLKALRVAELLQLYANVLQELNDRGVCRSTNNPVADLAETLAIKTLNLKPAPKNTKGYDALDDRGQKYEIKGRRITLHNPSRMLSAIRDCNAKHFDFLVGLLFAEDFSLLRACVVPFEIVKERSHYRQHTNANIFELKDEIWEQPGVRDITTELRLTLVQLDVAKARAAEA